MLVKRQACLISAVSHSLADLDQNVVLIIIIIIVIGSMALIPLQAIIPCNSRIHYSSFSEHKA